MVQQIIDNFFDLGKPCPKEIPMCEKVRQAYIDEVEKASKSGCSQCAKTNVKSRFIEAIWKEAVKAVTNENK